MTRNCSEMCLHLMPSPVSALSLGTVDDPRKTAGTSLRLQPPGTDVCLDCLALVRPIRAKAGQRGGGGGGRGAAEWKSDTGKGGDLLTYHWVNTFRLGSGDEMERGCELKALSPLLNPVTHYKRAPSPFVFSLSFCTPSV